MGALLGCSYVTDRDASRVPVTRARRQYSQRAACPRCMTPQGAAARTLAGSALRTQLLVDDLLEALVALRAAHPPAVDEERRRRADPEARGLRLVRLDRVERLAPVETVLELRGVEPPGLADLDRLVLHVVLGDLALALEEPVVHHPELVVALLGPARGRDRAVLGPGVDAREREVLEHEADPIAVLLEHLVLERGVGTGAKGALEIGVLDDRHLGVARSAGGHPVELDLAHHLLERVDGEVDGVAAEQIAAVAAHVEADALMLVAERNLERALAPAGDLRVRELADRGVGDRGWGRRRARLTAGAAAAAGSEEQERGGDTHRRLLVPALRTVKDRRRPPAARRRPR